MITFLILLVAYVLSQFYRAFLAIVAADLTRDIGLSPADLGAMSAAWFAAFAIAQFPVGYALDRFGPRRTMAVFMTAAVVGAIWLACGTRYADCVGAMALIGLGCSPVLMGSLYLFGRMYPVERFAALASLIIGLGSIGNLIGATPLAIAVEAFGWRGTMLAIAGVTALSTMLIAAALRDPPGGGGHKPTGPVLGGLMDIMMLRPLWAILPITFISYAVVIAARSLWIAPFFGEVHGYNTTATGDAALVMAIAMSLGALAYAPLERAIGDPKTTVLAGSFATGAAFVLLGLLGGGSAALAMALLAVIGAAGMSYGIIMAHARYFMPTELLGRGVTFMNFAFIAGAAVVQWLSGLFVEVAHGAGAPATTTFGRLHLAFGGVMLAATAIYAVAPARPRELRPR